MTNSLALSFVLIEYNCIEDIRDCVAGIRTACRDIEHEIVVSSNSVYTARKQTELKERFPGLQWRFNSTNLGFAGGINAGIESARHDLIVTMNLDVIIAENGLRQACEYIMSHERVGMLGPRIIDYQGTVQDSCRKFMTPFDLAARAWQRILHKKDVLIDSGFDYSRVQPVDWVIGAFMMTKRAALDNVGLLDSNYFLYVEDMDWCKRFWDNGWEVVYFPPLEVTYKGDRKSTSPIISGNLFNKYTYFHIKSYIRFLTKNKFRVSRNR